MRTLMSAFMLMTMVMPSSVVFNVMQSNIDKPPFALVCRLFCPSCPQILQRSPRYALERNHHCDVLVPCTDLKKVPQKKMIQEGHSYEQWFRVNSHIIKHLRIQCNSTVYIMCTWPGFSSCFSVCFTILLCFTYICNIYIYIYIYIYI